MMSTLSHPLVTAYLDRLHAESARLPGDQGRELLADIREHLHTALGAEPTEAQVRETLDRLGDPAELVDAAGGAPAGGRTGGYASGYPGGDVGAPGAPGTGAPPRGSHREAIAIVLLVAAGVLFPVWFVSLPLWIAGLVMIAVALRWDLGHKLLAVASWGLLPAMLWIVVGFTAFATYECTDAPCTPPEGSATRLTLFLVAGVLYLAFLIWASLRLARAAKRSDPA